MRSKHRAQVIPLFAALAVVCGLQHAVARQASEFASVGAAWIQCGGINGCPPGLICYDLPWQGHECPDGYHCLRLDQYYWQCTPSSLWKLRQPAPVAEGFGQCGGTNNCITPDQCGDRQWAICPDGFQCVRFDSFFAQCRPSVGDSSSTSDPAQVPAAQVPAAQPAAGQPPTPASEEAKVQAAVASTVGATQSTAANAAGAAANRPPPHDSAPVSAAEQEQLQQKQTPATTAAARPVTRGEAAPRQSGTAVFVNGTVLRNTSVARNTTAALNTTVARNTTAAADQAASTPVKVDLRYSGVSVDEFQEKYADGSLATVSEVSGVLENNISATLRSAAVEGVGSSSSAGSRRLLQEQTGVIASYQITAARPETVLQRLNAATANNGEQFFAALEANGVPIRPSISINGNLAVVATPVASSSGSNSSTGMPQWQQIVIGVVVGVGGLLLLLVVAFCCRRCMKRKAGDKQRKAEADLVATAADDDRYDATAVYGTDQGRQITNKSTDKLKSGSPDTVVQYGSDQQQSPFSAAQSTGDPQLTMLVNAAGRKTQPPSLTPSSTFESAAAAGAAAAALIEKSPRLRDTSPIVLDSPQYSPQYTPTKHEVEAMAIAAAAAAARAGRVTAAGSPAWDPSTSTRDIAAAAAAVQDAEGKHTGAATVEPWRPSKPSEPWKPTAPWKPPGRAEIPALPVPAVGTVPLRPVSNSSSAGYPAAARPAVGSAAAQKPAAAAATAAAPSAAAVMGIRRDTSESEYPATPRAGSLDVAGEDGDGYESGIEDGFATPKSSASFVSARSGMGSESSYRSVRSNAPSEGAVSAASYQTAATSQSFQSASTGNSMFSATSRATNSSSVSAATAASAATSASQWPRAYVPPVGVDLPTDSGSEGMPSPSIPLQPSNQ